ncbi:MAG: hypothetical protein KC619_24085 [Myxococcales bacterium]|nr:hypothetical protein [Myxococcales bacterium]
MTDAGVDAGSVVVDAGLDSGTVDAGVDAGFDASVDAGPPDAGSVDAGVDGGDGYTCEVVCRPLTSCEIPARFVDRGCTCAMVTPPQAGAVPGTAQYICERACTEAYIAEEDTADVTRPDCQHYFDCVNAC